MSDTNSDIIYTSSIHNFLVKFDQIKDDPKGK